MLFIKNISSSKATLCYHHYYFCNVLTLYVCIIRAVQTHLYLHLQLCFQVFMLQKILADQ